MQGAGGAGSHLRGERRPCCVDRGQLWCRRCQLMLELLCVLFLLCELDVINSQSHGLADKMQLKCLVQRLMLIRGGKGHSELGLRWFLWSKWERFP